MRIVFFIAAHMSGGIETQVSFDMHMDIGRSGMMKLLQAVGSNALSQCNNVICFIALFVIISCKCRLGFGTFAGYETGGLPGDLRA